MLAKKQSVGFSVFKRLLAVSQRYWPYLLLGLVATMLVSCFDAAMTWFLKPLVDKGFIDRSAAFIRWVPIVIIIFVLLRSVSGFLSSYCVNRVSRNVVLFFRQRLFAKYLNLPIAVFNESNSGEFVSAIIYNVDQVSQSSSESLLIMLREFVFLVGLVIVTLVVSWRLSLLFFVVTPMMYFVLRKTTTRIRKLSFGVQDVMADVAKAVDRGVRGCREIRLNGTQQKELGLFNNIVRLIRHKEMKIVVTNALNSSITQLLLGIPISCILYIAINPAMHITAGAFSSVMVALISMQRPFKRLMAINSTLQKGIAAAVCIFDVLDMPEEPSIQTQSVVERCQGDVLFKDVSFQYPGSEKWALKNINLNIKAGMTVALVGRSGAGKSTLISLLPRFFDPQKGVVQLDGRDINTYSLRDLRAQFATVSQNAMLFDDTIANNICYGVSHRPVSAQEIEQAAELANAMGFIQDLPQGLDSMVGQDGVLLSGGQRQRVAIARALLRDSPILVLDEATSALDSESERLIQQAFERLSKNRTTFVIAHRLSTVRSADLIVVIDQGQIVETGVHEELLSADGIYEQLSRMQFTANA